MLDEMTDYSTRCHKADNLVTLLTGRSWNSCRDKKPDFFPAGLNYTTKEWPLIHRVTALIRSGRDVPISHIFDLEEIIEKAEYKDHIILHKLKT